MLSPQAGLVALRVLVATQLVIHGSFRALSGGVVPFGGFLGEQGVPFGVAVAATITAVEIIGGLTLISGRLVRPLTAWFAGELAVGILLVHRLEGWFVVGGGRNGMEYSVVLICCMLIVGLTHPRQARTG